MYLFIKPKINFMDSVQLLNQLKNDYDFLQKHIIISNLNQHYKTLIKDFTKAIKSKEPIHFHLFMLTTNNINDIEEKWIGWLRYNIHIMLNHENIQEEDTFNVVKSIIKYMSNILEITESFINKINNLLEISRINDTVNYLTTDCIEDFVIFWEMVINISQIIKENHPIMLSKNFNEFSTNYKEEIKVKNIYISYLLTDYKKNLLMNYNMFYLSKFIDKIISKSEEDIILTLISEELSEYLYNSSRKKREDAHNFKILFDTKYKLSNISNTQSDKAEDLNLEHIKENGLNETEFNNNLKGLNTADNKKHIKSIDNIKNANKGDKKSGKLTAQEIGMLFKILVDNKFVNSLPNITFGHIGFALTGNDIDNIRRNMEPGRYEEAICNFNGSHSKHHLDKIQESIQILLKIIEELRKKT